MDLSALLQDGVVLIDKPCGHTSHDITSFVKKLLGCRRTGHAGTLDPQVSGVLPVALGRATKLLQYIASKRKTYAGIIKFRNPPSETEVRALFRRFSGKITQTPPRESAVRKVARQREIYRLELLELKGRLGLFVAEVEAGTYIRTLCPDIGKQCGGARMEELRRIVVGKITESQTVRLPDLIDAVWAWKNHGEEKRLRPLLHVPDSLIDFPRVVVKESAVASILNGAQIMAPAIAVFPPGVRSGDRVRLYSTSQRFLGVGCSLVDSEKWSSLPRSMVVRLERVHVER